MLLCLVILGLFIILPYGHRLGDQQQQQQQHESALSGTLQLRARRHLAGLGLDWAHGREQPIETLVLYTFSNTDPGISASSYMLSDHFEIYQPKLQLLRGGAWHGRLGPTPSFACASLLAQVWGPT